MRLPPYQTAARRSFKILTVKEALKTATAYLGRRNVFTPKLEAESLLRGSLKLSRTALFLNLPRVLDISEISTFFRAIKRRAEGVPLQYIQGKHGFRHLNLMLSWVVFIPRPETELLVEHVLKEIRGRSGVSFLDMGTGSGAIALSLAYELPQASGYGVDISYRALEVARANARAHHLREKVTFIRSDLFQNLDKTFYRQFDVIVANPPYIPSDEICHLPPEVKCFEPRPALDGGRDGLDIILKIVKDSPRYLRREGLLALEVGIGQALKVKKAMEQSGDFGEVQIFKDFAGIDRIILTTRS